MQIEGDRLQPLVRLPLLLNVVIPRRQRAPQRRLALPKPKESPVSTLGASDGRGEPPS